MKKKTLLLTFLLAATFLLGGGGQRVWAHDFTATNQGKTIYYTITDAVNHKVAVAPNGTSTNSYEGDIVIPEKVINPNDAIEYTVTSIASSAFKRSYEVAAGGRVTSVELPETIKSIGDYAFRYCSTYLTDINIPTAVESIGTYAFDACKGITSITLSSNLTSLGQLAFNACTAITVINYNAESISDFANNKGAFYGCTADITLNIGNNVTTIPAYAFQGANITGTVTIPDNVEAINASAFYGLTSISKLIIGSGVTTFGGSVFSGCTGLTEIIAKPTTVPTSGYSLFYNVTKSIPVYIPSGSKESYKANLQWNGFTNFKDLIEYTSPVVFYNGETLNTGIILLTGAGSIRIENGSKIYCDNILGSTPENLIIKDGGRLIVYGSGIQATVEKGIVHATNWGTGTTYVADGWYFIASPVNGAAFPTGSVANQDIYQLDWENNRWLNLQNDEHSSLLGAGFQRGTGYLYARRADNTISVAGEIQPLSGSNTATVTLAVSGWNLIGNPLTCNVTVDKDFSELTNASSVTNQEAGTAINPFQGIAVYGDAGDVVTFTKAESQNAVAPSNNNSLQMTLSQTVTTRGSVSSKVVDNAIVKFNGNTSLPKFSMLEGKAKLYIPQGNEQFAIVSAEAHGEIPVNFKANENGQYTLTVNAENMEMNYLHLIDNMTGADIDLMANPSYTFNANATDYASRFRLVFVGNSVEENLNENDNFAFIGSNGQLIVNGTGTIQIIDIMGRVISARSTEEHINTNNMTAGVYVLQLNTGSETKTQKIIVK